MLPLGAASEMLSAIQRENNNGNDMSAWAPPVESIYGITGIQGCHFHLICVFHDNVYICAINHIEKAGNMHTQSARV